MFTREDYIEYFELIAAKERAMVFTLEQLIPNLQDGKLVDRLNHILAEALEHYCQIGRLFEGLIKNDIEKRREPRDRSLGKAALREKGRAEECTVQCIDISLGGICIQTDKELVPGHACDLWITLYESKKALHRFGRIMWCRQADSATLFKCGIIFNDSEKQAPPETPLK